MRGFLFVLSLTACKGGWVEATEEPDRLTPFEDEGTSFDRATVRVVGAVGGEVIMLAPMAVAGFDCLDDTSGGVPASLTPKSYALALRRLVLLGVDGTQDLVLLDVPDVEEAEAVDITVDDALLAESLGAAEPGSYDGLEMQLWWMEMDLPMVIEEASLEEQVYSTTGWFTDTEPMFARDVTFAIEDDLTGEYIDHFVDRDTWDLVPAEAGRPERVLDLWEDEDFWAQDPVTLSTRTDKDLGFSFSYEGDAFEIPAESESEILVKLKFDVANRFTWWEYLPDGDAEQADDVYTVGQDCGFRVFFPDVSVTVDSEVGEPIEEAP